MKIQLDANLEADTVARQFRQYENQVEILLQPDKKEPLKKSQRKMVINMDTNSKKPGNIMIMIKTYLL